MFSILFGAFFPAFKEASASFLSFLGDQVYAQSVPAQISPISNDSDKYLPPPSSLKVFNNIKQTNTTDDTIADNTDINTNNTALSVITGPLGISDGKNITDDSSDDQISVYVVRKGDSLSQIANMFGISVNTILWANDMKKGDTIAEGDVLFILPISGLEHTVTSKQTLQSIAKLYNVDVNDILSYNDINKDTKLVAGDKLIIPNAEKSEEDNKPIKNLPASVAKSNQYYQTHPTQTLSGYYIDPVPGYRLSQGIHDHNAVDLAIASGTPIHAAASGVVTLARMGWNGAFGNLVIISHANGTETLYAHQSQILTYTGAQVKQGDIIGKVGCTGRCTGAHLHFEVHGARNPGADDSWKR